MKKRMVVGTLFGIVLLICYFFIFNFSPTGKVTLDIEERYFLGESILGNLDFVLSENEFIPADSVLRVSLGSQNQEISFGDIFGSEITSGDFYLEGKSISGSGEGIGGEVVYPTLSFNYKIIQNSIPEENLEEENGVENNFTEEENVESEDTVEENLEEIPVEEEQIEDSSEVIEESVEESPSPIEVAGSILTGAVISGTDSFYSGEVSKDSPFVLELDEGEEIEIISVNFDGEEISKENLEVSIEGNSVEISTDYSILSSGKILKVDLSQFNITAESGILTVSLIYEENEIVSVSKKLEVLEMEENETLEEVLPEIISNETELNKTINDSLLNETILNETLILNDSNLTITTTVSNIRVGEPVKWKKIVKSDVAKENISVEIPSIAKNVSVKKIEKVFEGSLEEENSYSVSFITGNAVSEKVSLDVNLNKTSEGFLTKLWKKIFSITGNVIQEEEKEEVQIVTIEENVTEVEITFETPAPTANESEISNGKQVVISGPDEVSYENVVAFSYIPESNLEEISLFWVNEGVYADFDSYDTNEDGKVDYIEWVVPHLSDQTYQIIIKINRAEHLDSNRTFIEEVYEYVGEKDEIFYTIPENDFLRVTFEKNLSNENDITLYAKGNGTVEVYEKDGTAVLISFEVGEYKEYKKYLDELVGTQNVFDLKVIGNVEFDYIVDPSSLLIEEISKLLASDGTTDDRFGLSVSISGDYAIVGAYQDDDKGSDSGSAYIFQKNSTGQFEQVDKITASDGAVSDFFGYPVSISGDYAIIGAYGDDDKGSSSGSAYIFKKNSTGQFEEINKLLASDGTTDDRFGLSVSISGDYAIVGSYQDDDKGSSSGSAYIFKKNSTGQFEEINKLLASDGAAGDRFGYSVSISGDYAIVSSYYDDDKGSDSGSAYIFQKNSTGQFEQVDKITASDGAVSDFFGYPVSISGDYAIIGAYGDDDKGSDSGSAYIFQKNSTGQFEQVDKITASDGAVSDRFGYSVSISGDYAIVGAYLDDDKGSDSGSAYIFKKNSTGQFEEINKLLASDGAASDFFGRSVSISEDYAIVGSYLDDDKGSDSGSAYVYSLVEIFPPEVEIISPILNGAYVNVDEITYSVSGENLDSCWYSFDFGETNSSTVLAGVNFTGLYLSNESYNLTVYCNNSLGIEVNDSLNFIVGDYNSAEEVNKLLASDGAVDDYFGRSVSISGDYAIIGAHWDDDKGSNSGSAYIFKKNSTGQFEEINKITASDGAAADYFGYSVSISGDYAIIGAYQDDDKGSASGSAYVYKKNSTGQFEQVNKLLASDGAVSDMFGYSVSISGDYAIVGAYADDSSKGSAYIFQKNSTGQFEQVNKLLASDGAASDFFGCSVSISGEYAIVGAYRDDSSKGSAYIFKKNSTGQFEEINKITASDGAASDYFGYSVSISGDYAIIGAYYDDDKGYSSGSAYIFQKNSTGQFNQVNKIIASDGAVSDMFGYSVSISGDYAIIGAHWDDDKGDASGSAYIFKKNPTGQFEEINKITASDGAASDVFGYSVSISGDYAIVGAYLDDDKGSSSGSAYVYNLVEIFPPEVEIISPILNGAYVNVDEITYSVSGENLDSCWYSFDFGETNSSTVLAGVNFTGLYLSNESYNLTVYCNNSLGIEVNDSLNFIVGDYYFVNKINKLLASDGAASDYFGYSVSISGDYAIVGAYYDDDKGDGSGSAYIFKKNSTGQFEQVNKILASDGAALDAFGYSVSISDDYAIVGAYQDDDKGSNSGSAYLYKKNSTGQFEQVNKLLASDGAASDYFGYSVSISGEYAIVGAHWDDDKGDASGSAYIFKKNSTGQFEQVNKLLASDGVASDLFGYSVSISGDYAIVGARVGDYNGSAYIFKKNSTGQFEFVNKIFSDSSGKFNGFGNSVSISGDYALIGDNYDSYNGLATGSAYIFKKNSTGQFEEVNKLLASDGVTLDSFGNSVSISGDYAIVGAKYDDDKGSNSGSAYIFKKNSTGQFEQVNKILASDGVASDQFGNSVSISGDYAIVGAYYDNDKGSVSGSAYVYNLVEVCVPSLVNTTPTDWLNISCLENDLMNQSRYWVEYDENNCGEIENQTYYEYKNITCDFCTPSLINTSASDWINLTCSLNQMNQSQFFIEYDENNCNEIENITHYNYQLIGPTYQNTTFSDWQTLECLPTDKYNQTRNLTQFDIYGCAINTTYFEFQDNVETCDFCTPSLFNTSWTEWTNDGICLADDNQQQIRSLIEYDSNECNEIENQTYYEYKNITCDFCTPSLINTSASDWINLTCSLNQMNQSQFWIEYDSNECNEIENKTYYDYQLIGPTYQNTTFSDWQTLECLPTDYYNQTRNLTEFDIYGCAINTTYFEYQDNVETCDFCTPSLANTSWTEWENDGVCLVDNNQQQIRSLIEYDSNECNEIENKTYYEYKNITCDFCTPSLINTSASDWINLTCSLNQMNQSQFWTEYDSNECNEIENKTYYDYQLIGPTYQNTTFSDWQTLECLPTDYYNQTRNLTEFDIYGCAINTTYFEYQDNVETCDFCTPNMTNTTWTDWTNDGLCLADDNQQQIRSLIEYDSNECNEIENKTYYEYKNITCDYCTPSLLNTSKSSWINLTCSLNQMNQSQFWTEYDSNECNEIENKTYYDYQLIGPTYQNTTFSDWQTLECLSTDYLNQTRNLTQFDIYGCAINATYFEYRDNVEVCDYCTPSLFNTSWTEWINDGICLADDNQQQIRSLIEYDSNECNEIENQTYYEYKNITCDFCTPSLLNTSKSSWINLTCSLNQMNQSQFWIEYDSNECNEIENKTYYDYQLIGPTYQNTTFSDWQTLECLPTDKYNQTRNLTQFDIYGCAINTTFFEYQDNFASCDFCTPNMTNTTWTDWTNDGLCLADDNQQQIRSLIEYDSNECNEIENKTYYEYKNITCDYCTPSLINTTSTDWINLTCSLDQMNQSQFFIEYDENNCNEIENTTHYNYQLIGPTYQNTTFSDWQTLECLPTDYYNQTRNLTQFDIYGCATNTTYFEFQDNVTSCDFCTPSLANTSWTEWENDGVCLVDNNQQQIRSLIEYDSNECNEIENKTYYEYKNITCDYCTPSLINTTSTDWINLTCSLNQMNQSQFFIEYDENNCNEIENTTHYNYQLIGPTYQNTSWSFWIDLDCLPTDYYNQTRNLTQFDIYGCATNTTYFEFQDNVTSCDFCTPSLANTSWTEWENDGVCLVDNNQQQIRSLIEYDSNECNEIENKTYYEYKNISCDYCTPSLINTTSTDWINLTCSLNQMNQSQFFIEYDENNCNEIENVTYYNYQLIGPIYQNTTFSDWQTLECLPTDYLNQTRNLTEFDIYGCADNTTFFEYQDNVTSCDFCTPSLVNTTATDWINLTCLDSNLMNQTRNWTEYDENYCNKIENVTHVEYRNTEKCSTSSPGSSSPSRSSPEKIDVLTTYVISLNLSKSVSGVSQGIKIGDIIEFYTADDILHTLEVLRLSGNRVYFTVDSGFIDFDLGISEERYLDLNLDSYDDFYIVLNNLSNAQVKISLRSLEVFEIPFLINDTKNDGSLEENPYQDENLEEENNNFSKRRILFISVVFILITLIFVVLYYLVVLFFELKEVKKMALKEDAKKLIIKGVSFVSFRKKDEALKVYESARKIFEENKEAFSDLFGPLNELYNSILKMK